MEIFISGYLNCFCCYLNTLNVEYCFCVFSPISFFCSFRLCLVKMRICSGYSFLTASLYALDRRNVTKRAQHIIIYRYMTWKINANKKKIRQTFLFIHSKVRHVIIFITHTVPTFNPATMHCGFFYSSLHVHWFSFILPHSHGNW